MPPKSTGEFEKFCCRNWFLITAKTQPSWMSLYLTYSISKKIEASKRWTIMDNVLIYFCSPWGLKSVMTHFLQLNCCLKPTSHCRAYILTNQHSNQSKVKQQIQCIRGQLALELNLCLFLYEFPYDLASQKQEEGSENKQGSQVVWEEILHHRKRRQVRQT